MKKKQLKVLIAPNSMKGSLNAFDFADGVEKAFLKVSSGFLVRKIPVADGGDFTGEVLCKALGAKVVEVEVIDPLGRPVRAKYARSGKKAVIEMADASGIKLLRPNELNPLETSSFGTGQLINEAIDAGCTEILLGVGGSATVDGGLGMIEALGFQLFDKEGKKLDGKGKNLEWVEKIEKPVLPANLSVKVICDVDNPLLGENGAVTVFGPQKGATPPMVERLEKGLFHWSEILQQETEIDFSKQNGVGAAGGVALPLLAFFHAEIVPGAAFVLQELHFDEAVQWADFVITGEGKIDGQTLHDKAPKAVADVARKYRKPVFAIGGNVTRDASAAFDGIFSLVSGPVSLEKAMNNAAELLFDFSFELAKLIHAVSNK
jgi:glycerate 2-kinase